MDRRDNTQIIKAIEEAIKITVNGKIDGIKKDLDVHSCKLDNYISTSVEWRCNVDKVLQELQPVNESIAWIKNTKTGAGFIAGFIAPWSIILGVLWAIVHFIRGT